MVFPKPSSRQVAWIACLVLAASLLFLPAAFVWHRLDLPTSLWEFGFSHNLQLQVAQRKKEIPLATIASGNWEIACQSDGYDEDVQQYGRTYDAAGRADDTAWGLLFIAPDGFQQTARGACGTRGFLVYSTKRCVQREHARLILQKYSGSCPVYVLSDGS